MITISIILLLSIMIIYNIFANTPLSVKYNEVLTHKDGVYTAAVTLKNGTVKNTIVTCDWDEAVKVEPKTVSLRAKETKQINLNIIPENDRFSEIKIEASTSRGFKNIIILKKN